MLDTSSPAVNSALQRARASFTGPSIDPDVLSEPESEQRATVERYVAAFERVNVEALVRLLADEVVLEMPPMRNWYVGPVLDGRFMARVFRTRGRDWRTVALSADRQPAIAAYNREGTDRRLHSVQLRLLSAETAGPAVLMRYERA